MDPARRAAEAVGIEPVILLNKTDLLADQAALARRLDALLAVYPGLGYSVLRTSTAQGELAELQAGNPVRGQHQ